MNTISSTVEETSPSSQSPGAANSPGVNAARTGKGSCDNCRRLKRKCDSAVPCGSCASKKLECTYVSLLTRQVDTTGACLPCRKAKRACNRSTGGEGACTACVRRGIVCTYGTAKAATSISKLSSSTLMTESVGTMPGSASSAALDTFQELFGILFPSIHKEILKSQQNDQAAIHFLLNCVMTMITRVSASDPTGAYRTLGEAVAASGPCILTVQPAVAEGFALLSWLLVGVSNEHTSSHMARVADSLQQAAIVAGTPFPSDVSYVVDRHRFWTDPAVADDRVWVRRLLPLAKFEDEKEIEIDGGAGGEEEGEESEDDSGEEEIDDDDEEDEGLLVNVPNSSLLRSVESGDMRDTSMLSSNKELDSFNLSGMGDQSRINSKEQGSLPAYPCSDFAADDSVDAFNLLLAQHQWEQSHIEDAHSDQPQNEHWDEPSLDSVSKMLDSQSSLPKLESLASLPKMDSQISASMLLDSRSSVDLTSKLDSFNSAPKLDSLTDRGMSTNNSLMLPAIVQEVSPSPSTSNSTPDSKTRLESQLILQWESHMPRTEVSQLSSDERQQFLLQQQQQQQQQHYQLQQQQQQLQQLQLQLQQLQHQPTEQNHLIQQQMQQQLLMLQQRPVYIQPIPQPPGQSSQTQPAAMLQQQQFLQHLQQQQLWQQLQQQQQEQQLVEQQQQQQQAQQSSSSSSSQPPPQLSSSSSSSSASQKQVIKKQRHHQPIPSNLPSHLRLMNAFHEYLITVFTACPWLKTLFTTGHPFTQSCVLARANIIAKHPQDTSLGYRLQTLSAGVNQAQWLAEMEAPAGAQSVFAAMAWFVEMCSALLALVTGENVDHTQGRLVNAWRIKGGQNSIGSMCLHSPIGLRALSLCLGIAVRLGCSQLTREILPVLKRIIGVFPNATEAQNLIEGHVKVGSVVSAAAGGASSSSSKGGGGGGEGDIPNIEINICTSTMGAVVVKQEGAAGILSFSEAKQHYHRHQKGKGKMKKRTASVRSADSVSSGGSSMSTN